MILAPLGDGVGVVLAGPGVSDEKESGVGIVWVERVHENERNRLSRCPNCFHVEEKTAG